MDHNGHPQWWPVLHGCVACLDPLALVKGLGSPNGPRRSSTRKTRLTCTANASTASSHQPNSNCGLLRLGSKGLRKDIDYEMIMI